MLNFIMVGNPGVGKSTLLNSMIGKVHFRAGWSPGSGLTYQLDTIVANGNRYHDTPGLSDVKKREQAARAIEQALKSDGRYKVFFVVYLMSGRVSSEDVLTMKTVLTACPIIGHNYGIIINKVPAPGMTELETHMPTVLATMFKNDFPNTMYIHVNQKDKDLDDVSNVFKPLPDALKSFVESVPEVIIKPSNVGELDIASFEEMKEKYELQVAELQNDAKKMQDKIDAQAKDFRSKIDTMEKEHARSSEKHSADLKQLRQKQQKELDDHRAAMDSLKQNQRKESEVQQLKMDQQKADHTRQLDQIAKDNAKTDADRAAEIARLKQQQDENVAAAEKAQKLMAERHTEQLKAQQKQNADMQKRQDELEQRRKQDEERHRQDADKLKRQLDAAKQPPAKRRRGGGLLGGLLNAVPVFGPVLSAIADL